MERSHSAVNAEPVLRPETLPLTIIAPVAVYGGSGLGVTLRDPRRRASSWSGPR